MLAGTPVAISARRPGLGSTRPVVTPRAGVTWAVAAVVTLVLGCGAPSSPSSPHTSPARKPTGSLVPLTAAHPTRHLVASQSLLLLLPEATRWQGQREGTYYRAVHLDTASELWVKRWRQGELVNAEQCAAQSLLWRPELAGPNESPVQTSIARVTTIPPGYRTRIDVQVWEDGETWRGQLTASGASIRDCFAYVYRTRAPRSPLGRAVVQQRIDVMQNALRATRGTEPGVDAQRDVP